MQMKLLFVINDNEKKLHALINKFKLPFNVIMYGEGTASQGILDFLNLVATKKNVLTSIIPDNLEKDIFNYLENIQHLKDIGKGVAFTTPLSSSSKYVLEAFNPKEGEKMKKENNYHLLITIVKEGHSEKVMHIAKKCGANGGTLLKGRGMGGANNFKFFNMTIEPEKDVVLIVCREDNKKKIMEAILEKNGVNTDSRGMCISLPIDSMIGVE